MRVFAREHQEDLGHTGERATDSDLCLTVEKSQQKVITVNRALETANLAKIKKENLP